MKIKNVKIVNFRSIKNVAIDFDYYSCRTLVGINESGKTNILKALSYLDKTTKFDNKSVRQPLVNENIINESYVQFVFNIENAEIATLISAVSKKLLIDKKETPLFKINGIAVSVNDFIRKFYAEVSYRIDFIKKNRDFLFSEITEDILANENIKMINKQKCPTSYESAAIDGTTIKLSDYLLIDTTIYKDIPTQYITEFDKKHFFDHIHNIRKEVIGQLPSVTYWEYKEKYLLPSVISLTDFIANPDNCIPLKNLFLLAGIDNISSELTLSTARQK
ncbi:MAG: AAA family ATPase [Bacteroidales bacterium]|jgi:predicted ATP-dependent endonuclease of OLD family|nr:AAA family ATPase [Bacteroidales bacterium]